MIFLKSSKTLKWHTSQSDNVTRGIKGKCLSEIPPNLSFSDIRLEVKAKGYGTMLSFAFLLIGETPSSKLKIPISFCNGLHTEAVLSAKPSLKTKYEGGREGERKTVHGDGKKRRHLRSLAPTLQHAWGTNQTKRADGAGSGWPEPRAARKTISTGNC